MILVSYFTAAIASPKIPPAATARAGVQACRQCVFGIRRGILLIRASLVSKLGLFALLMNSLREPFLGTEQKTSFLFLCPRVYLLAFSSASTGIIRSTYWIILADCLTSSFGHYG